MEPSREMPSNMKSLSTKMLQMQWKMRSSNSKCCNTFDVAARIPELVKDDPCISTLIARHGTELLLPVTYEVVLQILNPSAGNLVYAGKGGIGACQEVGEAAEPEGRSYLA